MQHNNPTVWYRLRALIIAAVRFEQVRALRVMHTAPYYVLLQLYGKAASDPDSPSSSSFLRSGLHAAGTVILQLVLYTYGYSATQQLQKKITWPFFSQQRHLHGRKLYDVCVLEDKKKEK